MSRFEQKVHLDFQRLDSTSSPRVNDGDFNKLDFGIIFLFFLNILEVSLGLNVLFLKSES